MYTYAVDYLRVWEFFTWGLTAGLGFGFLMFFLGLWSGIGFRWFEDGMKKRVTGRTLHVCSHGGECRGKEARCEPALYIDRGCRRAVRHGRAYAGDRRQIVRHAVPSRQLGSSLGDLRQRR